VPAQFSNTAHHWALTFTVFLILSHGPAGSALAQSTYAENLNMIRASSVRNTNHDNSAWRSTPMSALRIQDHFGPRSDYVAGLGGNREWHTPVEFGAQFRTGCEFSHFAYDDPLVHPDKPGAAHLHMFWGNTDVNAFSTYETLFNSGSSTCNGQELNRTGYWAPAVFDAEGNVRIPMKITVYYKGYGQARQYSDVYPPGAAMIANVNYHTAPPAGDTYSSAFSFQCTNQHRGLPRTPAGNTIPVQDAANPDNWDIGVSGWGNSDCREKYTTPNIEYIIHYPLDANETTEGWYLASDVNSSTQQRDRAAGESTHADWWGGWHPQINRTWIDNCATFFIPGTPTGCGFGYLSNGGEDKRNPLPGDALKLRPDYTGPIKIPARTLFSELCNSDRTYTKAEDAAYCQPHTPSNNGCDVTASANQVNVPPNQWRMLSLPCQVPESSTVADIFADDIPGAYGTDWTLFTYNPEEPSAPYANPRLSGKLVSGQGFWLLHMGATDVTIDLPSGSAPPAPSLTSGNSCTSTIGCVAIPLSASTGGNRPWNLLGNPYSSESDLYFDELRLLTDGGSCAQGCALQSANASNIIELPMYHYNGGDYDTVTVGSRLPPWEAYWLRGVAGVGRQQPRISFPQ